MRRRYSNLYIPSDFFCTRFRWVDAFPPDKPLSLNKPCQFHIMNKEVEPVTENDANLEPTDADYLFCAKVCIVQFFHMNYFLIASDSLGDADERARNGGTLPEMLCNG